MKRAVPLLVALAVMVAALLLTRLVGNRYVYFAGYVVLQYVVLATAWKVLGGYTGYVNFGTAAFFATGVYAINSLAMPMIGGTTTWIGPIVGAVLLGTAQQVATVTISSELNLLIVGVVLVAFVMLAPQGVVGLAQRLARRPRA